MDEKNSQIAFNGGFRSTMTGLCFSSLLSAFTNMASVRTNSNTNSVVDARALDRFSPTETYSNSHTGQRTPTEAKVYHSTTFPIPSTFPARAFLSFSFSGIGVGLRKGGVEAMVLDSMLSSPHRRSPSFRRPFSRDELSWSTLVQRHRFLLTALALLTFLCTVYLYFAVTLGASNSCSGLTGAQKASCHMQHVKASVAKGKLKIL
ncbi:hypothetical protein L6164_021688 [Bauhinia variegata]|uniref:Uncharacterized protein n=1 Tax=Bauhinia variegata TaxID=167791 RepID=A0ACB9MZ96_BAUVA|nr:hypothetical protein L6164_021688 [Bauhinia variegata]